MSELSNGAAALPCTRDEVLKFMGAVCYQLAAPSVAQAALEAGAKALGWDGMKPAIAAITAAASKEGKKSKKEKTKSEGAKERKPRGLTAMNFFTSYLMDIVSKDPNNPKFKMPDVVDADGNTHTQRGGAMVFAASCWRELSEHEKARFIALITPVMENVNNSIASSGNRVSGADALAKLQEHVKQRREESELATLVTTTVNRVASKGGAAEGAKAAAATPSQKGAANGAAAKPATSDKKRKKEEEKGKDKKKVKQEEKAKDTKEDKKKSDKKADKDKKKKKEPTPSSSSSDSSSSEDSSSKSSSSSGSSSDEDSD